MPAASASKHRPQAWPRPRPASRPRPRPHLEAPPPAGGPPGPLISPLRCSGVSGGLFSTVNTFEPPGHQLLSLSVRGARDQGGSSIVPASFHGPGLGVTVSGQVSFWFGCESACSMPEILNPVFRALSGRCRRSPCCSRPSIPRLQDSLGESSGSDLGLSEAMPLMSCVT